MIYLSLFCLWIFFVRRYLCVCSLHSNTTLMDPAHSCTISVHYRLFHVDLHHLGIIRVQIAVETLMPDLQLSRMRCI